jgi:hypothetical protein
VNAGRATIVMRPRSVRESLDLTLPFLIRIGGLRYLRLTALVLSPALALCLLVRAWLTLTWGETWLLALPLGIWLQGIFTLAAGELMFSEKLEAAVLLGRFARRAISYTGAIILTRALAVTLASTLVLGPWIWSRVLYAPEASLLEGAPAGPALARATRLGAGAGTFELLFWLAITLGFGIIGAEKLGYGLVNQLLSLDVRWGDLMEERGSLYALMGWFGAVPIAATFRFLRYIDARTRSDGWDIQVELQRVQSGGKLRRAVPLPEVR